MTRTHIQTSHRTTRTTALLVVTAGCLVIAACSKPAATPATTPAPSSAVGSAAPTVAVAAAAGQGASTACALVTEQEATAALGVDPGPGQETPLGDTASACSFLAGQSSLQLSLTPSGGKATYDRQRAGITSGTAGITEVSGVGDGAFSQLKGDRGAINFDKGDAMVVIGLSTAGTPPTQDQLTQLAAAAAGRL